MTVCDHVIYFFLIVTLRINIRERKNNIFVQSYQLHAYSLNNVLLFSVIIRLVDPFHGIVFQSYSDFFYKNSFFFIF